MKDFFCLHDFEKLRCTLSAHLSEVMPEAKYRQEILNLIHDVQWAASNLANAKLSREGKIVYSTTGEVFCSNNPIPEDSYKGILIRIEEIQK